MHLSLTCAKLSVRNWPYPRIRMGKGLSINWRVCSIERLRSSSNIGCRHFFPLLDDSFHQFLNEICTRALSSIVGCFLSSLSGWNLCNVISTQYWIFPVSLLFGWIHYWPSHLDVSCHTCTSKACCNYSHQSNQRVLANEAVYKEQGEGKDYLQSGC